MAKRKARGRSGGRRPQRHAPPSARRAQRDRPVQSSLEDRECASRARRRTLFKLAVVCLSLLVSVCVAEAAIRLLDLAPPLPQQYQDFIDDPYLAFRKKPNTFRTGTSKSREFDFSYRTNSAGFRDREHTLEKPAGVFRIVAVGDSFSWGAGAAFEETYLVRLEALLNRRSHGHPEVEIIKAGQPRYFPEMERHLLEHYGMAYEPDLVLVTFLPNDVVDTVKGVEALRPSRREGYLLSRRSQALGSTGIWLYLNSHTARVVLSALATVIDRNRAPVLDIGDVSQEDIRAAWQTVFAEYNRMRKIAHEQQASFVVVSVPQAKLSPVAGQILAAQIAAGVDAFIDTQPALAAVRDETGRPPYWPKDGHCTPEGYGIIAQAVYDGLVSHNLVP
ncbi:MAG: SGNH/GDSL hydrolase family protein [Planctomycetes bacterium]|nr:SGNH/GDSL hydrolase family protein [Planctomycetota bacterium]